MNFSKDRERGSSASCQTDTHRSKVRLCRRLQKKHRSYLFHFSHKYLIIYLLTFITAITKIKIIFP